MGLASIKPTSLVKISNYTDPAYFLACLMYMLCFTSFESFTNEIYMNDDRRNIRIILSRLYVYLNSCLFFLSLFRESICLVIPINF